MSGECAIFTESSGGLGDIIKSGVKYGIGQLPYYEGHGPQNTIPGGASLWVFGGKSDEEYKGVAQFFNFLSQTKIQARLHQVSGYMPVTNAAYEETKKSGFYDKNPGRETPILQMMGKAPDREFQGCASRQPATGSRHHERGVRSDAGRQQDAKAALDKAVERGNAAITEAVGN
jgi:sn-glycerol 3-phosphate transport system substrate-binding protein